MLRTGTSLRTACALGAVTFFFIVLIIHINRDVLASSLHQTFPTKSKTPIAPAEDALLNDIYNNTLGFGDILVVSLPSRTDRRDGMVLQAALTNMSVSFVDGISGSAVSEKAVPKKEDGGHIVDGELGSWRGHMNAIQQVIHRNLSSALIMEDDGDWDIRLKQQLHDFALASRALTQPLKGYPGAYADPTFPNPSNSSAPVTEIPFEKLPETEPPKVSPYGDDWDIFWVGHCTQTFPSDNSPVLPKGRVIRRKDATVPERRYLQNLFVDTFILKRDYPDHTRAVHYSQSGVCTLAYAISQRGARKLLLQIGLKAPDQPFDLMLREYCDGNIRRGANKCLTTQPSLLEHYRPVGPLKDESDIKEGPDGFRSEGETAMIRWSVRLNAERLIKGETELVDQWPDSINEEKGVSKQPEEMS